MHSREDCPGEMRRSICLLHSLCMYLLYCSFIIYKQYALPTSLSHTHTYTHTYTHKTYLRVIIHISLNTNHIPHRNILKHSTTHSYYSLIPHNLHTYDHSHQTPLITTTNTTPSPYTSSRNHTHHPPPHPLNNCHSCLFVPHVSLAHFSWHFTHV